MALFHYTAVREGTRKMFSGDREAPDKHALVEGVQFHPESILTDHGKKLIDNFLKF